MGKYLAVGAWKILRNSIKDMIFNSLLVTSELTCSADSGESFSKVAKDFLCHVFKAFFFL